MQEAATGHTTTSLTDARRFHQYTERVLEESGDNWTSSQITVDNTDVAALDGQQLQFTFHHMNMTAWLKELYGDPSFKGHFALRAQPQVVGVTQPDGTVLQRRWVTWA